MRALWCGLLADAVLAADVRHALRTCSLDVVNLLLQREDLAAQLPDEAYVLREQLVSVVAQLLSLPLALRDLSFELRSELRELVTLRAVRLLVPGARL